MQKKQIIVGICILMLLVISLSGCTEKEATSTELSNNIFFESDKLQLINSSLDLTEKHGTIIKAEVSLRFRNLLDKTISAEIGVDFCDSEGNVLYKSVRNISYMPPSYSEYSPNVFTFIGNGVEKVDHANVYIIRHEID